MGPCYNLLMYLKRLELVGFKSFAKKSELEFSTPVTAIVGPNGSGKSNVAEAFRFVLGEQSFKSMRTKRGEDLIWSGSGELGRASRASVRVVFDNPTIDGARVLNVDFDEVSVERTVFRDGTNEYSINGSKVRLKDVQETLSSAHIGSSGHHIISQGEADRVLTSSPRERREMIEDALGLRTYQYKKDEASRKLEKTYENKTQVEQLRSENAPHLRFLERQVNKLEKARELRTELTSAFHEYLAYEEAYLAREEARIKDALHEPQKALGDTEHEVARLRKEVETADQKGAQTDALLAVEHDLHEARREEGEARQEVGRLQGQIAAEERRIQEEERRLKDAEERPVPLGAVRALLTKVRTALTRASEAKDIDMVGEVLEAAHTSIDHFLDTYEDADLNTEIDRGAVETLAREHEKACAAQEKVQARINELQKKLGELREAAEREKDDTRRAERDLYEAMARETELRALLAELVRARELLAREADEFSRERIEAVALVGEAAIGYTRLGAEDAPAPRDTQQERRRALEKMKIRIEEMGGANADEITKEYEEVKERDAFLERELADLAQSAESLEKLIADLDHELDQKFKAGFEKVASQFNEYFTLMFGGGSAVLSLKREKKRSKLTELFSGGDEEDETGDEEQGAEGIEVEVSLPKKKIQNLVMLSGGERALTSIALIFAMSQVNPPPFLILDETDAALDEANSRRYGDIIEHLAQHSQLILISHNRETMSRAGVLYGVTMSGDGISKLLSVKFEEAASVAK